MDWVHIKQKLYSRGASLDEIKRLSLEKIKLQLNRHVVLEAAGGYNVVRLTNHGLVMR